FLFSRHTPSSTCIKQLSLIISGPGYVWLARCILSSVRKVQSATTPMKTNHQSSRRKFLKAGAVFIAASGLGTAVNSLAKEKNTKENEVSPPEDLMREHGALKRILLICGEAIRRIDNKQDLPPKLAAD